MSDRDNWEYKMAILVREDIRLSPGKMAAQVAHAAVSCTLTARTSAKRLFKSWLREGQRKVVLKVADLAELQEMEIKARKAGFIVERIADAGLTEIPPGTVTCVGIGPGLSREMDPITGHLKLA